jgi:hypothetical protein
MGCVFEVAVESEVVETLVQKGSEVVAVVAVVAVVELAIEAIETVGG